MVECGLPKPETRFRFPPSAYLLEADRMSLYSRSEISVTQNVTFSGSFTNQSLDPSVETFDRIFLLPSSGLGFMTEAIHSR